MLTPKQIEDARKQLGINTSNPSAPTASNLVERLETKQQNSGGYLDRLKGSFQARQEEVKNINSSDASLPEKILQNAGQVAGGAFDIVAQAPVVKQGLDLVGKGVEQVAKVPGIKQGIELGVETYNKLPQNIQKDLEAVINIASLVPVGMGAKGSIVAGEKALATGGKVLKAGEKGLAATKKVAGEIIPSADRVVNFQVSKALDLTAGDIKNINLATGNEVGEFLATKNLIRGNKVETTKALQDFFDTNYKTVRGEINKVNKTYSPYNVPRYTESLKAIKKQVDSVPGLEKVSVEVENLLNKAKDEIVLNDVQKVKELLDEHFSLYKVTGDVKEGVAKEGLSNLRKDLKEFIEKEVKNNTGTDIKVLNNEVSTAKSTLNAIEERSTKGLTASNIKMGDFGTAGVGFMVGGIPGALVAVAGKKVLGTSAIRLKFAKWLDAISDAKKLRIQKELEKGIIPEEVSRVLNQSKPKAIATANTINKSKNSIISPKSTTKSLKVKGTIQENSLISEARKYKSAEEFVNSQQNGEWKIIKDRKVIKLYNEQEVKNAVKNLEELGIQPVVEQVTNQSIKTKSQLTDIWKKANKK